MGILKKYAVILAVSSFAVSPMALGNDAPTNAGKRTYLLAKFERNDAIVQRLVFSSPDGQQSFSIKKRLGVYEVPLGNYYLSKVVVSDMYTTLDQDLDMPTEFFSLEEGKINYIGDIIFEQKRKSKYIRWDYSGETIREAYQDNPALFLGKDVVLIVRGRNATPVDMRNIESP